MALELSKTPTAAVDAVEQYDSIIIGAGLSGMYQLYRLRELGMSVRVFEAGSDVGGTWYWNRYPGCRFDSESYSYGYSWSEELLQEWDWKEHFSPQPENLKYCNFVADRFDLRRDMEFNSRVKTCTWDEQARQWEVEVENGRRARARYLITAIGPLSIPMMPDIPGVDDFKGESYHTGLWPHHPVELKGKRIAVIGTGATGVQVIQEVAKVAGQLTVFQRRPNWCAPLHNRPIDPQEQKQIKASYPEIFAKCAESVSCFLHKADSRKTTDVTPEEREAFYEKLYGEPGFGIWLANFRDTFTDEAANKTISDFIARKIRERVKDPVVAERLIPKDHGFGTRRVPMETGYYEVYNQDNVELVSVLETPIERITPKGVRTTEKEREFDIIIYATGFDAIIGGFSRIDFRGVDGRTLKDAWAAGPRTFLGMEVHGFPNLLTLVGPHNGASFSNIPRCIEQNVDWTTRLLAYMTDKGYSRFEATEAAVDEWTEHVYETSKDMLMAKVDSWFNGININIKGRDKRQFLLYAAGAPTYRKKCDEVADNGYAGMTVS